MYGLQICWSLKNIGEAFNMFNMEKGKNEHFNQYFHYIENKIKRTRTKFITDKP